MSDSDGPLHSPHRKTTTASDDLTSVTVRKESLNEKSGIFLVERQGVVYVTKIAENGLFHNTEIDVGDVVLSINGKRLKKGEGSGDFIKTITQAKATVTVVVKKLGKKPTRGARSLSPRTRRKKKTGERRYTGLARRNQDGSLNSSQSPIVSAYNSDDDEDVFEQYHITGTKIFANQDAGLAFQEDDNMLFVSKIALDSIFRDTELEVGDRVCLINQMNFMTYADRGYAKTVISKATSNVEIVVEKGHKTDWAEENGKVPRSAFNPLSPRAFTSPNGVKPKVEIRVKPKVEIPYDSSEVEISDDSSSEESGDRKSPPDANRGRSNVGRNTSYESPPRKIKNVPKLIESPFKKYGDRKSPPDASRGRPNVGRNTSFESPKKIKSVPKVIESPFKKSGDRKCSTDANRGRSNVGRNTSFESPKKIKNVPKLTESPFKSSIARDTSFESPKKMKYVPNLTESPYKIPIKPEIIDEDYGHDFIRVTIQKISERKSGVSVTKTEGKFILTAIPDYEKRISVGDEVLAINGTRNINTVMKADDLIDRTKGSILLIVNFDVQKDFESPCCGKAITCKGKHINGKGGRGKDEGSATESVATAQAGNTKGPKKPKVPSIPETPLQCNVEYNMEDYDSESESDDESEESELIVDEPEQPDSRYSVNDKFMVNVAKTPRNREHGITLLKYQGEYYVSGITKSGIFYNSPINKGDKILSINGKKSAAIKDAAFAEEIMDDRDSISMFVLRTDPTKAEY